MWDKWTFHTDEKFESSTMIISLSTGVPQYFLLYSQARELAKFLLERTETRKLATYYSSTMEEFVQVGDDNLAMLPAYEVHELKLQGNLRDGRVLLFSGYASPRNEVYEFCERILTTAKERWGVKRIISIGARWSEEPTQPVVDSVKVYGFGGTKEDVALLRELQIPEHPAEVAPYFANVIVGLAPLYGIKSIKLSVDHGEVRPHPKQVKALLMTLSKILGFELNLKELDEEAEKLKAEINLLTRSLNKGNKLYDDSSLV
jgi:Uncharacterized protein (ATP-grasp superfamily)